MKYSAYIIITIVLYGCSDKKPDTYSYYDSTYIKNLQQISIQTKIDSIQKAVKDSIYFSSHKIWMDADSAVVRLSPSVFYLPDSIITYLEENKYTIPQIWFGSSPHNVISGYFCKPGQLDWAVLGSKDHISSIIIFWNGSIHDITEIEKYPDISYLQGVGKDSIGYSRSISKADTSLILNYYRTWSELAKETGEMSVDSIDVSILDHDGIEDSFVEKASGILYLHKKKWMTFQGAD